MTTARRIYLAAYPQGMPTTEHLKLEDIPLPVPAEGQVLLRVIYLSLDPYMRGRMSPTRSYAAHLHPGDTMVGGTVCEVMESRLEGYAPGDFVLAGAGWQTHALSDGTGLRKLDPAHGPLSAALGVLGMPGFTAYVGLLEHGKPKPGETIVVSAASGAVGQAVGQIGRLLGCRVIGVAGAEDKCRYVTETLGFDAAVNYREDGFPEALAAACPDGVDIYFENVGGPVFEAVLPLMNDFGRIPVCGRIAHYNDSAPPPGPDRLPAAMGLVLTRRLTFRGFLQFDHIERMGDFLREMGGWLAEGKVIYREEIVDGLENTVDAFQGLLTGRNRGKLVIRVGADPTQG
ncbi:NADP-dependent oxidoreductase (plasmid) [Paroceanicella profunda]|uniref:NADP-dependent oxidoreductase n=1 Tax=Paroceanicella profunda TaxID=2579971 RepID=A0A5B8G3A5_9RHOB|nr:NADP-dependent oxidoreductase [Paroceanicella profunda]QDL94440.1 NADP-dependent oxidoreductase [Paroceanicella profunda]